MDKRSTGEARGRGAGNAGERPAGLRFPMSRHRLPGAGFTLAYAKGRRARGSSFTVVVRPNDVFERRLGLSVGKRCWKSAVRRNRVRRVFREAFRLEQAELPPGIDVVMIGSTQALVPDLERCRQELRKLSWKAWRRYLEANPEDSGAEGTAE